MEKNNLNLLLTQKKTRQRGYRCQRCRNHNVDVARKGHVDQCPFKACQCSNCVLVERRTDTHRLLKQKAMITRRRQDQCKGSASTPGSGMTVQKSGQMNKKGQSAEKRTLSCAKCSNHDTHSPLKNHKQCCPYRYCRCSMCHLVDEYRNILKDQIRTRRMQCRQQSSSNYILTDILGTNISHGAFPTTQQTLVTPPHMRQSVIVSSATPHAPSRCAGQSIQSGMVKLETGSLLDVKPNDLYFLGHLAAYSACLFNRPSATTMPVDLASGPQDFASAMTQKAMTLDLASAYQYYEKLAKCLSAHMK